jgi:hypothetical protein
MLLAIVEPLLDLFNDDDVPQDDNADQMTSPFCPPHSVDFTAACALSLVSGEELPPVNSCLPLHVIDGDLPAASSLQ